MERVRAGKKKSKPPAYGIVLGSHTGTYIAKETFKSRKGFELYRLFFLFDDGVSGCTVTHAPWLSYFPFRLYQDYSFDLVKEGKYISQKRIKEISLTHPVPKEVKERWRKDLKGINKDLS